MSADEKTRLPHGSAQTAAGTQLSGIYELDELLGLGGMGEVWRGHNIQTGDLVAIKIVLPEFARDQTILSLFRKEASILNHLSHEAVVRYHVFTIDPGMGRPYLAMEYVDGDSLYDVLRRGPMPPEDVRRLCHRLASGLGAVHRAGAIHRDLSPDNIILPGGRVERAKIIDFGIARSATVGGETLIGGRFAGKYNYVSPEQLGLYGGEVSERSDIYSLGLVLAAALNGKPLDMSGSQLDVIEKRRVVPDLSSIDGELRPTIEAMLQPDPQDRPASMAEIAWATRGGSRIEDGAPYFDMADDDAGGQTTPPRTARDRTAREAAAAAVPASDAGFVEHVRPAILSKPRPLPGETAPEAKREQAAPEARNYRPLALTVGLVVAAVAGAWFGGYLPPWGDEAADQPREVSRLEPAPTPPEPSADSEDAEQPAVSEPQPAETREPDTPPVAEEQAASEVEQAQPVSEPSSPAEQQQQAPAEPLAPATAEAEPAETTTADRIVERLLEQAGGSEPAREPEPVDENVTARQLEPVEDAVVAAPAAETALTDEPSPRLDEVASAPEAEPEQIARVEPDAQLIETPEPATPARQPEPLVAEADRASDTTLAPEPDIAERQDAAEARPAPAARPAETPRPSVTERDQPAADAPASEDEQVALNVPDTTAEPPARPLPPEAPVKTEPEDLRPPPFENEVDDQATPETPELEVTEPQRLPTPNPADDQQAEETTEPQRKDDLAFNVPQPEVPAPPASTVAERVAWLREFSGGDCFFAAPVTASQDAMRIEGFGPDGDPFESMHDAFESRFGFAPDVEVRVIEPAQCAVARFMRGLPAPKGERPELRVDQMSIPSGGTLSGAVRTAGGMYAHLLLVDHAGMVFSLDPALVVEGGEATFKVPITLDAGDNQAGKALPEVLIAIAGPSEIAVASPDAPTPASTLLPMILSEIEEASGEISVTAKYFQIGG